VNANRFTVAVGCAVAFLYVVADYAEIGPLRLALAVVSTAMLAMWVVVLAIVGARQLGVWRKDRRTRREVSARIDRLNQTGW